MPLAYPSGTVAEHRACRQGGGGLRRQPPGHRPRPRGRRLRAPAALAEQRPAPDPPGRAQYTHLLDDDGSVIDDIIVWWVDDERFDVMPNASNTSEVVAAIGGTTSPRERAVIAVQGPRRAPAWPRVAPRPQRCTAFGVARFEWARSRPAWWPGPGYTGEDGVECAVPAEVAVELLGGRPRHRASSRPDWARATPCASRRGCRCTATSSARASRRSRPGWAGWSAGTRGTSPVAAALEEERANGPARRLRGFVADGRQPLRDGSRGRARRRTRRHPDQRQLLAHARAGHRAGLRGRRRPPARRRCRHGRPARARAGRHGWSGRPCGRSARRASSSAPAAGRADRCRIVGRTTEYAD